MKFNKWSRERRARGIKKTTARSKPHPDDPDVLFVFKKPIPLGIIKKYFYIEEGAESPEELQRVINQIWRRKVPEDRELYLHVLKPFIKKDDDKNPMHYCLNCDKWLGFRGFCSQKCHDEYYDRVSERLGDGS